MKPDSSFSSPSSFLSRPNRKSLKNGWSIQLLSARQEMDARQEAETLCQDERDQALFANACLLARALLQNDAPVFQNGTDVLEHLSASQIASLANLWCDFDQENNPSVFDGQEATDSLKKAWSTRLMNAFNGVCLKLFMHFPPNPAPKS